MIEFQVEGMSCQHCVSAVTKAIQAHAPGAHVQVELEAGRVRVDSDGPAEPLSAAIADAGYTVKSTSRSA